MTKEEMTKETLKIGLSRTLKQLQLAEKELRRLGVDEYEVLKIRTEISALIRKTALLLSKQI